MFPHLTEECPITIGCGDVDVWATSSKHIGASTHDAQINGVRYSIRLDLHLRDGEWQRGYKDDWRTVYHALLIRRVEPKTGTYNTDASDSARRKAERIFIPWLIEVAESTEGHDLLVEAERVALDLELYKITREGQELAERALLLAERVDELDARQRELVGS
jgi:hypothetical protein